MKHRRPSLKREAALWSEGRISVAGIDEVGRGPLRVQGPQVGGQRDPGRQVGLREEAAQHDLGVGVRAPDPLRRRGEQAPVLGCGRIRQPEGRVVGLVPDLPGADRQLGQVQILGPEPAALPVALDRRFQEGGELVEMGDVDAPY